MQTTWRTLLIVAAMTVAVCGVAQAGDQADAKGIEQAVLDDVSSFGVRVSRIHGSSGRGRLSVQEWPGLDGRQLTTTIQAHSDGRFT